MRGGNRTSESIAVIGIGCRMPGGVTSPAELWGLLMDRRDPVDEGPFDRWDVDSFYEPDRDVPGRSSSRWAATVDGIEGFDAAFFGISPAEAASMDPQHRLVLEAAWEALEHAGMPPRGLTGAAGGVFVGIWNTDNAVRLGRHYAALDAYAATTGNAHSPAAGRVSYALGLRGPALAVDTACSSSLVATHLAIQSLRAGESDFAIAGGVNALLSPEFMVSASRFGMLSPTGRCRPFDHRADGLVRSEGVGLVVLKRLADAERDGDRVLAVIRGSAVNQDGRSNGLVAPDEDAQRAVYHEAIDRAGVDPAAIGLVETHGPGTPVGDPIEFRALAAVYGSGDGRCALGSIKSNIGHLESAAGIAGLIKAVLAVSRGVIPPNLHFERWNPSISPESTRFFVPTEATDWPVDAPTRLAAVSSFGFSGTNAHVVLESPPTRGTRQPAAAPRQPVVVPLSGASPEALTATARRLLDWLEQSAGEVSLDDVAHTLGVRRSHERFRAAIVAESVEELLERLERLEGAEPDDDVVTGAARDAATGGVVWVCPGQGSQWAGMGRRLIAEDAAFGGMIDRLEPLIAKEAGFSLTDTLRAGAAVDAIDRLQLVLFATQVALAEMWRAWGLSPSAVIGQSMGEVSAAVIAGALSLEDGVKASYRRARQLLPLAGTGAMASVDLPYEQVEEEARRVGGVTVAVMSSTRATVVSGDPDNVHALHAMWEARGQLTRLVASDVAAHGPHVDPVAAPLVDALADLTPRRPDVPVYSTVSDDPRQQPAFDGAYWAENLRLPVRALQAVRAAAADGHRAFLEVSVHPVVRQALRETLADIDDDSVIEHTVTRDLDGAATVARQLAALFCAGVPVDFGVRHRSGALLDLPTMAWRHQRHWIDLPLAHPQRPGPAAAVAHPLLGAHARVPDADDREVWSPDLGTAAVPLLAEHRVDGVHVLPAAASCEIALAAAMRRLDCPAREVELTQASFDRLLTLDEHTEVSIALTPRADDHVIVEVLTRREDATWTTHATAELRRREPAPARKVTPPTGRRAAVDVDAHYASLREDGYDYGPAFTALRDLAIGDGTAVARIELPRPAKSLAGVMLHPVLLDAGLQTLLSVVRAGREEVLLPTRLSGLRVLDDPRRATHCHVEGTAVRLVDGDGVVLVEVDDVEFTAVERSSARTRYESLFHELRWVRSDQPAGEPRGNWLVLAEDDDALAGSLVSALAAAGAPVERAPLVAERGGPATDVVVLPPVQSDPSGRAAVLAVARVAAALGDTDRQAPRLWMITVGARAVEDADTPVMGYGGIRGIARVAACEHPQLRPTLVDVGGSGDLGTLMGELLADGPDDEVALRSRRRWVARLGQARIDDGTWNTRPRRTLRYGESGISVHIARPGDLDTYGPVVRERVAPGPGEIEIQTAAVGINFADVMQGLGLFPAWHGTSGRLGFECAGTVVAVHPFETEFAVGDRVMAFHDGSASTFVTLPSDLVARTPSSLTSTQAATVPAAYVTAWHALVDVARLRPGEQVLIHAGTGGVGLAAIAIARSLGAEVLATAGHERKREYLRDLGIEHVMDSRSLDFAEQALVATEGRGVDVVLNSLSGPALHAGIDTLAIGGRFIELGKRDIFADTKLGMTALRKSITIAGVDVALLARRRPRRIGKVLREVARELSARRLDALPYSEWPFEDAASALRHMAAAKHIGKLVLSVPQEGTVDAAVPPGRRAVVRSDSSYVVTGGAGGLGAELTRWLARRGARRIVLNGRSDPSGDALAAIAEARAAGVEVRFVAGDIAAPGVAALLVGAATVDGMRLGGVVHAAAVLDDGALTSLDNATLERVWRPKAAGAWRLHEATLGHGLDWLVLFSSMASALGSPGQAAYAAANDWLDSFAQWRRSRGLPALAVNWGAWGEAGRATQLGERGYATFSTSDGLRALEDLLDHERVSVGVFAYDPGHWFQAAPWTVASALFADMPKEVDAPTAPTSSVAALVREARSSERATVMTGYLRERVAVILGLDPMAIGSRSALPHLGFDSLNALQLRHDLQRDLELEVAATLVWSHPTLPELARHLVEALGLEEEAEPADGGRAAPESWFRRLSGRVRAPSRLYCFPHAGGSASTYRGLAAALPEGIETLSLQLPGREDRVHEPHRVDLIALAAELAGLIGGAHDGRPYALLGHSGGSFLAFETARALVRLDAPAPEALIVSAVPAPDSAGMRALVHTLFRAGSPETLEALAAIPAEVRADAALFEQARQALAGDYQMYRGYRPDDGTALLDCPIVALGGDDDPVVRPSDVSRWREQTTSAATTRTFAGGHFYLRKHSVELAAEIARVFEGS